MLINEVCKTCRLTKKAVEYYIEQQLLQPEISENGYRNFSIADVEKLKKISILRRLGLSVQSIKEVSDGGGQTALYKAFESRRIALEAEKMKGELLQQLAKNQDWEHIICQLEALEKRQTVLQRLLNVFPGYYGKYICLHFARYLNEPIVSDEQQEAFETVVDFLDHASLDLPPDLRQYLDEITKDFDENFFETIFSNINAAIVDAEKYMEENKELLERYMQLKQSDEFQASPAYRLQEHLKKFNRENGYDAIFIPAMKKLSPSYRKYHNGLEKANEVFLNKYQSTAL